MNNDGSNSSTENEDDDSVNEPMKGVPSTQLGLVYQAIQNRQVTLANSGCWMVMGADGATPYAVRLFLKEICSCPAASVCYHILACKIMIGQDFDKV